MNYAKEKARKSLGPGCAVNACAGCSYGSTFAPCSRHCCTQDLVAASVWKAWLAHRAWACTSGCSMAFSPGIHSSCTIAALIMPHRAGTYFHLHLVSDATGETLTTVARAATAQYTKVLPVEHVYPLVRTQKQLDRVLREIEESPGIVLYTLLDDELMQRLENHCREMSMPCLSILGPVLQLLRSYLGTETAHRIGAQHTLNAEYFKRIEALNYTMLHDDGQHPEGLEEADVVLVGVSRTSKTPTSIYLANRGVKTGNFPLVPGLQVSPSRRRSEAAADRRPLRQSGADRADSPEPIARSESSRQRHPVYRSQGCRRGGGFLAQIVRASQLAEHRRNAALDRGDRSGCAQSAHRPPSSAGWIGHGIVVCRPAACACVQKHGSAGDPA